MDHPSSSQIEEEIRSILDGADLSTLSSKKVRRLLEETFNTELTSRKKEIDKVLMDELAKREKREKETDSEDRETDSKNGVTEGRETKDRGKDRKNKTKDKKKEVKKEDEEESMDTDEDEGHSDSDSFETPDDMGAPESKKKQKEVKPEVIDDEELARRLQAEDGGGRRTRHCNKQKQVHKKVKKEKKEKKTKDSKKGPGPKTGYNSNMVLSAELAEIMGTERMSRAEVVKKMWEIVKERQLADPKNKQYHICDDQLLKVFGTKRVRTFSMMKYLKRHIKDPDLLSDSYGNQ